MGNQVFTATPLAPKQVEEMTRRNIKHKEAEQARLAHEKCQELIHAFNYICERNMDQGQVKMYTDVLLRYQPEVENCFKTAMEERGYKLGEFWGTMHILVFSW